MGTANTTAKAKEKQLCIPCHATMLRANTTEQ